MKLENYIGGETMFETYNPYSSYNQYYGYNQQTKQIQTYRTTQFAQAEVLNGYYVWSNWKSSNIPVHINFDTDQIIIYSASIQIYQIYSVYNNGNAYPDSEGGRTIKFDVIDQDYDKGTIRLRVDREGNSQIYIDFANIAWVYNVVRTN